MKGLSSSPRMLESPSFGTFEDNLNTISFERELNDFEANSLSGLGFPICAANSELIRSTKTKVEF